MTGVSVTVDRIAPPVADAAPVSVVAASEDRGGGPRGPRVKGEDMLGEPGLGALPLRRRPPPRFDPDFGDGADVGEAGDEELGEGVELIGGASDILESKDGFSSLETDIAGACLPTDDSGVLEIEVVLPFPPRALLPPLPLECGPEPPPEEGQGSEDLPDIVTWQSLTVDHATIWMVMLGI